MMKSEEKTQKYYAKFHDPEKPGDPGKLKNALDRANDNRKFEIELYWRRSAYVWTLIAAAFAGYFVLLVADYDTHSKPIYDPLFIDLGLFIIACLGFVFTFAWTLVCKGSKFWQENWENHVDLLEDKIQGELYKTVLRKPEVLDFSVSSVNLNVSYFVQLIWFFLALFPFIHVFVSNEMPGTPSDCLKIGILLVMILLVFVTLSWCEWIYCDSKRYPASTQAKPKQIEMIKRTTHF